MRGPPRFLAQRMANLLPLRKDRKRPEGGFRISIRRSSRQHAEPKRFQSLLRDARLGCGISLDNPERSPSRKKLDAVLSCRGTARSGDFPLIEANGHSALMLARIPKSLRDEVLRTTHLNTERALQSQ